MYMKQMNDFKSRPRSLKLRSYHACENFFIDLVTLFNWDEVEQEPGPVHSFIEANLFFTQQFFHLVEQ